jgi:hypothetical protein
MIPFHVETLINGKPIINLPPKTINLKKVDFTQEERSFYLTLEERSRQRFKVGYVFKFHLLYLFFFHLDGVATLLKLVGYSLPCTILYTYAQRLNINAVI